MVCFINLIYFAKRFFMKLLCAGVFLERSFHYFFFCEPVVCVCVRVFLHFLCVFCSCVSRTIYVSCLCVSNAVS